MVRQVDELFDAAYEGRGGDVVKILRTDVSLIHIGDAIGDTAFHVAARAGHAATVLKMIKFFKKVDSNMLTDVLYDGNGQGDTPMHLAIKHRHKKVATHIVRVAEPRIAFVQNDDQVSPFQLAQQAGYKRLFERFASIPITLCCDMEMRMVALSDDEDDDNEDGKEWIIGEFEEDEDMIQCKDEIIESTTLHEVAFNGKIGLLKKMVQIIESRSELKRQLLTGDHKMYTPLHSAVDGGQEKTARYLIELEPRATYKVNRNGDSSLYLAVKKGYTDLVRYMVKANLSQSVRDRILEHAKQIWLAHTALKQRNSAVFQALMEGLPELINVPDKKGWKLFSLAAYKNYFDEMCYVMKHFPDSIAIHDEDGSLPIHKAVAGGHVSVVKEFILRCPRAPHDVDKKGRNLIELATLYQSKDVVSYLQGQN